MEVVPEKICCYYAVKVCIAAFWLADNI